MNRMIWHRWAIAVQLINALLLFAFSIYLGVTAYPLVAFFQDRGVSAAYVLNVAVIVTLWVPYPRRVVVFAETKGVGLVARCIR